MEFFLTLSTQNCAFCAENWWRERSKGVEKIRVQERLIFFPEPTLRFTFPPHPTIILPPTIIKFRTNFLPLLLFRPLVHGEDGICLGEIPFCYKFPIPELCRGHSEVR